MKGKDVKLSRFNQVNSIPLEEYFSSRVQVDVIRTRGEFSEDLDQVMIPKFVSLG